MLLKDQLNRTLTFDQTPTRIVSLVPSQTELLVDLGLEKFLVGITKFCVHPTSLRKKKIIVGGTKKVNYAKIKDLRPDIIICNKEENTQEIVQKLAKLAPVYVSDILSIHDNCKFIKDIGTIFRSENNAEKLLKSLHKNLNEFKSIVKSTPQKKVIYFIWKDPWMVAGGKTYINELLELNNFNNLYQDIERYPIIDILALEKLDPELILLSSEPYPFQQKHLKEIQKYTNAKVLLVDGEYFSWYGSHLAKAFDYFKTLH